MDELICHFDFLVGTNTIDGHGLLKGGEIPVGVFIRVPFSRQDLTITGHSDLAVIIGG